MQLLWLEQFMAVVKNNNNVSMAAKQLYIAQPSLSKNIAKLEDALGCKLFDKERNRLKLNRNGEIVLACAEEITASMDQMYHALEEQNARLLGRHITMGFDSIVLGNHITKNLFYEKMLGYSVEQVNDTTEKVLQFLLDGTVDLAFLSDPAINKDIEQLYFLGVKLGVSVPLSNPLSQRESLRLQELNGQKFIRINSQDSFFEVSTALLKKYKIKIREEYRIAPSGLGAVIESDYLIFSSSLYPVTLFDYSKNRRILFFSDSDAFVNIYMCYKKSNRARILPVANQIIRNYDALMHKIRRPEK